MERIGQILNMERCCKKLTDTERSELRVKLANDTAGDLNSDGYNCEKCKNKGYINYLDENNNEVCRPCECLKIRASIKRIKKSGLESKLKNCTFDKFVCHDDWQEKLKSKAQAFCTSDYSCFFVGGQSGCGKTHICTAICGEFLNLGKPTIYMLWRDEITSLMSNITNSDKYSKIELFKKIDVLYIDDLFKVGKGEEPTKSDINITYEILNYRYNNPELITIISSERFLSEIVRIDEATGGRIKELSGCYICDILRDSNRNFRFKKEI